jgi:RNA polymerase sigma-70 factor (ECF subfamily)
VGKVAAEVDDAALVRAVQAGDAGAFEELFRRHHASVRRVCARRLCSLTEADEVAQAAFVRAFERIDKCTAERRFGAWVQVIAFRLCADAWRAGERITPMADPPAGQDRESCEDAVLRTERVAEVRRALAALPRRQREVIVARDGEGRRPGEVAAALAVSVGAVDSLLLRARRRMVASCRAAGVETGSVSPEVAATSVVASTAGLFVPPAVTLPADVE